MVPSFPLTTCVIMSQRIVSHLQKEMTAGGNPFFGGKHSKLWSEAFREGGFYRFFDRR